jgi:DNA topoisomerase-1
MCSSRHRTAPATSPARFSPSSEDTELRGLESHAELWRHPPLQAAERASLTYVSDAEAGIRRRAAGRGFYYLDAEGKRLTDAVTVARIKSLAIPPAWTDVWIASDTGGHIQATGRDQKGRKQYRYHPSWTACRDEAKFTSLAEFARRLPALRERVESDLRRRSLSRDRVIASIVWMLDNTLIRIGNEAYARTNKSFGLTTLRARHVALNGSTLRLSFTGKSGQQWKLQLGDRRVLSVVRRMQELPGQRLFQYVDEDGGRHDVRSQDVNAYIQEVLGEGFTSKHFRTWGATTDASFLLAGIPVPSTKHEQARTLNAVVDKVARRLHNTRVVCRRCYIHPEIVERWLAGKLTDEFAALSRRYRRPPNGLDREEALVLRWLEQRG